MDGVGTDGVRECMDGSEEEEEGEEDDDDDDDDEGVRERSIARTWLRTKLPFILLPADDDDDVCFGGLGREGGGGDGNSPSLGFFFKT